MLHTIKRFKLFHKLNDDLLNYVESCAERINIGAGEMIFKKGDPGDSLYLISEGEVKIHDDEYVFSIMGQDQFFGEYAMLDNKPRSASVTAKKDSLLLKLSKEPLKRNSILYLEIQKALIQELTNRLRNHNELEQEISRQRDLISRQKKNITDSIEYAKRIQSAALPDNSIIDSILPNSFIYFKPKDIVSGDFYWIKEFSNKIVVIASDCTGHGVPGAFMSMLGISMLNNIVSESKVEDAATILDLLREKVKYLLKQEKDGGSKDGMDLACLVFEKGKDIVQFAGANNPLYIIHDSELIVIKGDKMPIGVHLTENINFTNHKIKIYKNDMLYIFSDGYADQFGGEHGRKFMYKPFKNLLLEIHSKSLKDQKSIVDDTIVQWKNNYPQVDDILVMGIRID